MGIELTIEQQNLVVSNMHLVGYVIKKYIRLNKNNIDMDYEDLNQIGNIGLCKAAYMYNKSVQFNTYAEIIRNELLGYCRESLKRIKTISSDEDREKIREIVDTTANTEKSIENRLIIESLSKRKCNYSGIELKGIEAMELKLKGLTGSDIAKMYNVKTNHISAWISRAKSKLKDDKEFMQEICCK